MLGRRDVSQPIHTPFPYIFWRDVRVICVDGKVFYRRCGKDSFQVHGNDFFLTRDKE